MKTMEFKANDSITLKAMIEEIYKQAREDKMFVVNRPMSGNFSIVWKDMMAGYDYDTICIDRIYKPQYIKKAQRDIYETSPAAIEILKNIENVEEQMSKTKEEDMSDEEKQYYISTIDKLTESFKNTPPALVKKDVELYINDLTNQEWAVQCVGEYSDELISEIADMFANYVLSVKYFLRFHKQLSEVTICAIDCGEWFDVFVD